MSVYCPNCGIVNEEHSKFCMSCGTPLTQQPKPQESAPQAPVYSAPQPEPIAYQPPQPAVTQEPVYSAPQQPVSVNYGNSYQQPAGYPQPQYPAQQYAPAPAAKPKKKKGKAVPVIIVSVIALLLVAAAVLIVVLPLTAHVDVFGLHLFDNSPKQVTERMLRAAYSDFNAKEVVDCLYEMKYAGDKAPKDSDIQQLQTILDNLKSQIKAANTTMKYNILDEYYVEEAKYNEYIEKMKKDGIDTSKIEKMIEVDFNMEAMGQKSENKTALCIKADGKWYVSQYTFGDAFGM